MAFQAPLCQASSNFLIKNGNQQLKVKDTFRGHAADARVCREYTAGTLTRPEGHYRPRSGRDSLCSDPPPLTMAVTACVPSSIHRKAAGFFSPVSAPTPAS